MEPGNQKNLYSRFGQIALRWLLIQVLPVLPLASCGSFHAQGGVLLPMLLNLVSGNSISAEVIITQSDDSTYVTEGGTGDTISISLGGVPSSPVTVAFGGDAPLRMEPSSVEFAANEAGASQTVTVYADDNSQSESSPYNGTLRLTVESADSRYQGLTVDPISVNILDDDTAGIIVSSTALTVAENGEDNRYTVQLTGDPGAQVTLTYLPSRAGEVSFSPASVVFDSGNWNTPQTIHIAAVDDSDDESGTESINVRHVLDSTNPDYDGDGGSELTIHVLDNDPQTSLSSVDPVQSGEVSFVNGGDSNKIISSPDINPVDASRSIVFCTIRTNDSDPRAMPTCQLNGSGEVVITRGDTTGNQTVVYTVVQFAAGFSVQRGSLTLGPAQTSDIKSITSVDLDRAFIIASSRNGSSARDEDEARTAGVRLSAANELTFSRSQHYSTQTFIEYQVVEFSGARVQSGSTTIANGSAQETETIDPVDLTRSFVVLNYEAGSGVDGVEGCYYARARMADSTTLELNRGVACGPSENAGVNWFVVEMLDGTSVQSGTMDTGSAEGNSVGDHKDTSLTKAVTPVTSTRSFLLHSNDVHNSDTMDQDVGNWTGTYSSGNIVFDRITGGTTNVQSRVDYFLVELPAP